MLVDLAYQNGCRICPGGDAHEAWTRMASMCAMSWQVGEPRTGQSLPAGPAAPVKTARARPNATRKDEIAADRDERRARLVGAVAVA